MIKALFFKSSPPTHPDFDDLGAWHGHVRTNPEGRRARCGGPRTCPTCQLEQSILSERTQRYAAEDTIRRMAKLPTQAQADAGNYKKRTIIWRGLRIRIENEPGQIRQHANGETRMVYPYGYFAGTDGVDGDEVDVFVGPNLMAPLVFVVHQRVAGDWNEYDEDKVMIGFDSADEAASAYLAHYDDPRFLGPMTAIPAALLAATIQAKAGESLAPGGIA